jgi:hypothetical protein
MTEIDVRGYSCCKELRHMFICGQDRKNPFKLISFLKFIFIFISYKANPSTKVNFKTSLFCLPRCFIVTLFDIIILLFDYVSFTQKNANDARLFVFTRKRPKIYFAI